MKNKYEEGKKGDTILEELRSKKDMKKKEDNDKGMEREVTWSEKREKGENKKKRIDKEKWQEQRARDKRGEKKGKVGKGKIVNKETSIKKKKTKRK